MKIVTLAFSALGLAGLSAAQNGNDPLIYNNRTALHVSVPVTPPLVRSNTFIHPTASIECWRNGYPCGQNGGQRSQRLVADFIVPTPFLDARIPPPKFFSIRTDVKVPGMTEIPGEMPLETLAPVPEPTGEVSMGILPIPVSLGGEPPKQHPPTGEAIFSDLPITPSVHAPKNVPTPTSAAASVPYDPYSTWPSHWRGATSEVAVAPSPTTHCNGTMSVSSTLELITVPATSSHFAIPPDPTSPIVDTYTTSSTLCVTTPELTPLPISTVSGIIQDPLMTPAPATSTAPSMSVPEGMQERLVYCGTDKCVPIEMADLTSCHNTPTPRSGPAVAPEITSTPPAVVAPVTRELITVTIDCSHHYCHSVMETVYTLTPTLYTYPIVPATSDFAVPPEVTHVDTVNKAFVPIDWWRGPNESNVPEAPKEIKNTHGPI